LEERNFVLRAMKQQEAWKNCIKGTLIYHKFTKYYYKNEIEEGELGGTFCAEGTNKKCIQKIIRKS
jgi:hypothetical protein